MKQFFLAVTFIIFATTSVHAQTKFYTAATEEVSINQHYEKADSLNALMKRYCATGLPGVALAVYSEKDGWWGGTGGFSKMENKTPMANTNLQYLQSVSKTYMAVAVLQLYEQNKIKLDAPITNYLPVKYSHYIKQADKMTVRMLLNHTSGVPEYSTDPAFISLVIEHPLSQFSTEQVLKTIKGRDPVFTPGTRHSYSNTNYELLALITDAITGDHAAFIARNIFKPLNLRDTWYRNDRQYPQYKDLVDTYWDVLDTGSPANITAMQKTNVASFIGDDGIVCTTTDAVKFLKALMEGKLVNQKTLGEMKTWVNDDEGNPAYGLGLVHYSAGGIEGYGHSGGGIGAGCILMYVPARKLYFFIATNIGTLSNGRLPAKANQLKDEIIGTLLQ